MPISEKLKTYIQAGNGMLMGTRDASMKPEIQRALGAIVVDDNHLKVFVDGKTAGRIFQNMQDNQMVSLVMCSKSFESYQFKGKSIRWTEISEEESGIMEDYMKRFGANMVEFGAGEGFVNGYPHTHMMTLLIEVTDIFEQTPKIGTGQRV